MSNKRRVDDAEFKINAGAFNHVNTVHTYYIFIHLQLIEAVSVRHVSLVQSVC